MSLDTPYVLDPEYHKRLIADIQSVSEVAGVPVNMIERTSIPYLNKTECRWLKNYPEHKREGQGLLINGVQSIAPDQKMCAIAACLLRNFVDARVMTLQHVIDWPEDRTEPTVLLIPNLFAVTGGKARPDWEIQRLYDRLLHRRVANKLTVGYVEDLAAMNSAYGSLFYLHLTSTTYVRSP